MFLLLVAQLGMCSRPFIRPHFGSMKNQPNGP